MICLARFLRLLEGTAASTETTAETAASI
jgi:hypothetical protein